MLVFIPLFKFLSFSLFDGYSDLIISLSISRIDYNVNNFKNFGKSGVFVDLSFVFQHIPPIRSKNAHKEKVSIVYWDDEKKTFFENDWFDRLVTTVRILKF